jgi:hypothetical protein
MAEDLPETALDNKRVAGGSDLPARLARARATSGAGSDREPEVVLCERRRVADAVADHCDDPSRRLQLPDDLRLVGRQHLCDHLADSGLRSNSAGGVLVVAGEEQRSQTQPPQLHDRGRAGGTIERGAQLAGEFDRPLLEQRQPARDERVSVDDAFDAEAVAVAEALDRCK